MTSCNWMLTIDVQGLFFPLIPPFKFFFFVVVVDVLKITYNFEEDILNGCFWFP